MKKAVIKREIERLFFLVLACFFFTAGNAFAKEENSSREENRTPEEQMGITEEVEDIEKMLHEILGEGGNAQEEVSFRELMGLFMKGDIPSVLVSVGTLIKRSLFEDTERGSSLLIQTAILGIVAAVFTNLSSILKEGQISETGFYVTYLLLFSGLAGSFLNSLSIASGVLKQILDLMRALLPAYFMAAAFVGGSVSTVAMYEGMLMAVTAVQWLCAGALLTAVKMFVLLVLGSHISREPFLSRMTDLIEKAVEWSLKTLFGLVTGIHLLQAMILPYADGLGQSGMRRLVEMIPGVGNAAEGAAQMVLGSGVLIKNSMGAAAVVFLAIIAFVPVVKLLVLMLMYQVTAAVMQPVCDKRMVSCVSGVARGHKLLLEIVLYSLSLFILAMAITCSATNVTYLAG